MQRSIGVLIIQRKNREEQLNEGYSLSAPPRPIGKLEQTDEPYAMIKIAGIKLCESCNRQFGNDSPSVMPTNIYGQRDNFHPANSHAMLALSSSLNEAAPNGMPDVLIWGIGEPGCKFLHANKSAHSLLFVLNLTKPDRTPGKLMDRSRLNARGWKLKIALLETMRDAHRWFLEYYSNARQRLPELFLAA
ncbi:NAD-dependent epimerase/dehydratase family protein [Sphingobium sp. CECT 9361]|uniref:NAD-dependent epimerase/dehydratase family protein n=1 Tax=Sphingobium sp. CECT 9361 TaxID=2845384 RepID=UPI001EF9BD0B|nr:NAD-dependent epimerase/dehydratase family protein [Sphingobium sp. CECT 9361]CAH0356910.1 GDP-L-fucose synthase [Sphingobium sp. CECT 9361]